MKFLEYIRKSRMETSGNFFVELQKILKIKPQNKSLYKEAFTHSSVNLKTSEGDPMNFERLEYLGDSILNSIVAEFLFHYYPGAKEGELTKLRAKIVSRSKLNEIGKKMKLFSIAQISNHNNFLGDNIHGNLLESFTGALFIDKGYIKTKKYVIKHIITPYIDMESLDSHILSHKALLLEWGQKNRVIFDFETAHTEGLDPKVNYSCQIFYQEKYIAKAKAASKKKAEEKAARIAVRALRIKAANS